MILAEKIIKKYDQHIVLDEVTISFPERKMIGFIGSNGAGKSTLLSIISRTLAKNSGKIFIDNKELPDWKSEDLSKELSILKQSNHLNIRLTVRELVEFGRYPYTKGKLMKADHEKVDEAIGYLGLEPFMDSYLDELSGGQRQMAYIAMVVAQDTKYIFLDEPLNNLDMRHSVQIMKVLRRLVDELGKTILIVIHDINFVSNYADYIIAMKDGKIVEAGETDEILSTEVLKEIYGIDIDIHEIGGNKICCYYS